MITLTNCLIVQCFRRLFNRSIRGTHLVDRLNERLERPRAEELIETILLAQEAQPGLAVDGHPRNRDSNFRRVCRLRRVADPAGSLGGNDVDR